MFKNIKELNILAKFFWTKKCNLAATATAKKIAIDKLPDTNSTKTMSAWTTNRCTSIK
jgi:hypothetical protein